MRTIVTQKRLARRVRELNEDNQALMLENVRLENLAYCDPLTGLKNRRFMEDQLNKLWWEGLKQSRSLSLLFIDIDDLKKLNTELGHYGADQVIKLMAGIIKAEVCQRYNDFVCRYGGDEIVVILPNTDNYGANYLVSCIHQTLGNTGYSVSIGVSTIVPGVDNTAIDLIELANQEMYKQKTLKKARVC